MTADAGPTTLAFTLATPPADAIPAHSLAVHTVAVLDAARRVAFQHAPTGRYLGDPPLREQLGLFHRADPDTAAEGTYLSPVPLCQAVAARCLASDVLRSSIGRVRHLLRPRHDAAVAAVRRRLGGALLATPNGGYYLGVRIRVDAGEPALLAAARAEGIVLSRGSAFHPPGEPP